MGWKTSLLVGSFKVLKRAARDIQVARSTQEPPTARADVFDRMHGLKQRTASQAKSLAPRTMARLSHASAYGAQVATEVLAPFIAEALDTETLKRHPESRLTSAFKLAQDQLPVLATFLRDVNRFAENWQETHAISEIDTNGSAEVKHDAGEEVDAAEALDAAAFLTGLGPVLRDWTGDGGVKDDSDDEKTLTGGMVFTPSSTGTLTPNSLGALSSGEGPDPVALAAALAGLGQRHDDPDPLQAQAALREEAVAHGAQPDPQAVVVGGKPPASVPLDPTKSSSSLL